MQAQTYLFFGNLVVWLGVAGYVAFLAAKSARLEQRLNQMEAIHDHGE